MSQEEIINILKTSYGEGINQAHFYKNLLQVSF